MPLYGIDIRKHIKYFFTTEPKPTRMPEPKVKELGLKMLRCIQQIHSLGYVHCDIKPENFVFASTNQDEKNIVLIDFGMVHKFIDKTKGNRHIPYEKAEDFKGTPSFSSLSALKGYRQSRRDDIESLTYVLMYASHGELPWQQYRTIVDYEEKIEKIIESKSNIFCYDFIKEVPNSLIELLKYCRSLQFREKPNYTYIESLFQSDENSELKPCNPFKLVIQDVQEEEEKADEKGAGIVFNKFDKASNKSFTPNSSFTDQNYIKSFSFLKEKSNNE